MVFSMVAFSAVRLTGSFYTLWFSTAAGLASLQFSHRVFTFDWAEEQLFIWVITGTLTVNRTHSFCHEYLNAFNNNNHNNNNDQEKEKRSRVEERAFSFIDLFNYIFYFPLFFYGPVLSYDQFVANLRTSALWAQTT